MPRMMMHTLSVMLLLVMVSLTVSLVCWLVLGVSLRRVLAFLCNDQRDEVKEISGIFWQRLYLSLTLFTPLLCVLLFAPNFERSLADNLLYALRWAVFGGVSLLLVLAYLVRKQIQVLQRSGFEGVQADKQPAQCRLEHEATNGLEPVAACEPGHQAQHS